MRSQPPTPAAKTEFLDTLASWSGRPLDSYPRSTPPVHAIGSDEEDVILAGVFAAIAADAPFYETTRSLIVLTSAITRHQRYVDLAWEGARGSKPGQVASRANWSELRRYEQMIGVLHLWHEALFDQAMGVAA